jgi:hypothetical protein
MFKKIIYIICLIALIGVTLIFSAKNYRIEEGEIIQDLSEECKVRFDYLEIKVQEILYFEDSKIIMFSYDEDKLGIAIYNQGINNKYSLKNLHNIQKNDLSFVHEDSRKEYLVIGFHNKQKRIKYIKVDYENDEKEKVIQVEKDDYYIGAFYTSKYNKVKVSYYDNNNRIVGE